MGLTEFGKSILPVWAKELRSGKWEQGKGVLCDGDNRYCCLGVLESIIPGSSLGPYDGYRGRPIYRGDETSTVYLTETLGEAISN